jgi:CRP/FNR family cyclic AMP-dependent transcriptional regulator
MANSVRNVVLSPGALGESPLCQDLSSADLAHLARLLHPRWYAARTPIVAVDQPGDQVGIVLDGAVKVVVDSEDGSQVILAILTVGEIVGEMSVVDSLTRSATVVTLEDSRLLWIDRSAFWECLRSMPALSLNLARILSRRLRVANAQIRTLATLDVHGRVARQLLTYADEYGQPGLEGGVVSPFRLTQVDLAGLTGASRVRVNQVLVDWKSRGTLSVDTDHRVTIHDRTTLLQSLA